MKLLFLALLVSFSTLTFADAQADTSAQLCQGSCQDGEVELAPGTLVINATKDSVRCLPQNNCAACYGKIDKQCLKGKNAAAYYGVEELNP